MKAHAGWGSWLTVGERQEGGQGGGGCTGPSKERTAFSLFIWVVVTLVFIV